jgi:hypothetical protein
VNRSEHNPLQWELARGRSGEPHPDADLLTAFAESALLKRERKQVLKHLALCAECREVLSNAAEAAPVFTAAPKPFLLPRRALLPQRVWLPWASLAAVLLVVCSVGFLYQQRLALQKRALVATNEAMPLPSPIPHPLAPISPQENKAVTKAIEIPALKPSQLSSRSKELVAANAMREAQHESAEQSSFGQQNPYRISSAEADKVAAQDSLAQKAIATAPATAFVNTITERALSTASVAAAARPHWRINSTGQAERSFGDGAWQAVLPNESSRMRVISVFSGEVWIGGENSRLYHSSDNGATWKLIALPSKDGPLHSIAHIHFQTLQSGTVEAEDGTFWTTADGGSAWK